MSEPLDGMDAMVLDLGCCADLKPGSKGAAVTAEFKWYHYDFLGHVHPHSGTALGMEDSARHATHGLNPQL